MKAVWVYVPILLAILLICGMAMYMTGEDNKCTDAGGHLEWSLESRTGADCVRDGVVIRP